MKITKTEFDGLLIIEPRVFDDNRGYFFESYNSKHFNDAGIDITFVQDNQSCSKKNVIRGLHFQKEPYPQSKLVRCLRGSILDVVVDLRKNASTFKKVFSLIISAENRIQVLIPKGFAHGFSVLSEEAEVLYKCDEYYYPAFEAGIMYNDPELNIDWKVKGNALVSPKDQALPAISVYH